MAISLIVGLSINLDIFKLILVFLYIAAINFIKVNEVNPIAYKSSVIPNSVVFEMDDAISNNAFSVLVSGAINSKSSFGLGRSLMLTFPFGVFGISSSCINTDGSIYLVNLSFKNSFKSLVLISYSAVK